MGCRHDYLKSLWREASKTLFLLNLSTKAFDLPWLSLFMVYFARSMIKTQIQPRNWGWRWSFLSLFFPQEVRPWWRKNEEKVAKRKDKKERKVVINPSFNCQYLSPPIFLLFLFSFLLFLVNNFGQI